MPERRRYSAPTPHRMRILPNTILVEAIPLPQPILAFGRFGLPRIAHHRPLTEKNTPPKVIGPKLGERHNFPCLPG
jgi:hypothetical protein